MKQNVVEMKAVLCNDVEKFLSIIAHRKRKQMAAANNGRSVTEKRLFHGTNPDSVDPICSNGFDWRLCGMHGTVYGQGESAQDAGGMGQPL